MNEGDVLVTGDAEKTEILNTFFASVFASKTPPQDSWTLEGGERAWEVEISPLVDEGVVWERLSGLNTHISMDIDGMHPRVLRELGEVITRGMTCWRGTLQRRT